MDNAFADAATKDEANQQLNANKASLFTATNLQPIHADDAASTGGHPGGSCYARNTGCDRGHTDLQPQRRLPLRRLRMQLR